MARSLEYVSLLGVSHSHIEPGDVSRFERTSEGRLRGDAAVEVREFSRQDRVRIGEYRQGMNRKVETHSHSGLRISFAIPRKVHSFSHDGRLWARTALRNTGKRATYEHRVVLTNLNRVHGAIKTRCMR